MGFQIALSPYNLMIATVGILLGTIIGVPGLGGANGVAILLPVTFVMPHTSGIILLSCIYWGALFGGAITSILFNILVSPGRWPRPLTDIPWRSGGSAGRPSCRLHVVLHWRRLCHHPGDLFAPLIAEFSLHFGPPEFLGMQLLTFSAFIGLGGTSVKTLASILVGFLLGAVGMDIVSGQLRLTFGTVELMRGFSFVVAVIGLFGIVRIFLTVEEGLEFRGVQTQLSWRVILETAASYPPIGKRSCARPSLAPGWALAWRRHSRLVYELRHCPKILRPQKSLALVCWKACSLRTAAHAAGVSALLPMITLGIPGSPTAAVMLGGLLIWGLQPGPMLFRSARTLSGADCQHVYGECHRCPHCPALRPGLCRHPQDALCHLDPRHCLRLCHWRLCGQH